MFTENNQPNLDLNEIVKSENIANLLDEEQNRCIAHYVVENLNKDVSARSDWDTRMADSMDLALQVVKEKTFPFPNASNVKFPLVTIAALQYIARAYSALIPSSDIVKVKIVGPDMDGAKQARADRISDHMSYQLLEEDCGWEENMDKTLIVQSIIGCAFKKTYFDADAGHNKSRMILPKDLYIPYYASTLEDASRITEILYWSHNDLESAIRNGLFVDHDYCKEDSNTPVNSILQYQEQEAHGVHASSSNDHGKPIELIEQHCWMDLDGDGFNEPYIVTVHRSSEKLCRIVARFFKSDIKKNKKGQIYKINATQYYTKFPFIPSPDGSIYDLGFGLLLGPINKSIDTTINQLIDAGTISNTAGGFLGRGAKFKSGDNSFRPFEWKRVDSTGDDLRKNLLPYPVREPSQVLYNLLVLLINYGERIGMATDPMIGVNPGQNTPAETSRNMISEGQKQFNAIYKRTWRSLKQEFQKLYDLNRIYLEDKTTFFSSATSNGQQIVLREDYAGSNYDIRPAADPYMVSDQQKLMQSTLVKQASMSTPGYDLYEVEKMFLKSMRVSEIDKIYPNPKSPDAPQTSPPAAVQVQMMKNEIKDKDRDLKWKLGLLKMLEQADINRAKIVDLEATAQKTLAEAKALGQQVEISKINTQIEAARAYQEGLLKQVDIFAGLLKEQSKGEAENGEGPAPEPGRMATGPAIKNISGIAEVLR